jgi:Flp pilus assembly protein TadG
VTARPRPRSTVATLAGRRDREAGNAPLELVLLAPIVLILIGLVIAAGRTALAQGAVQAAARDAARQASIARTPQQALSAAIASAQTELTQQGLGCSPAPIVRVDTVAFGVPLGQPATVTATVTCWVPLSDLAVPGLPGRKQLFAKFSSPLDPYRGR